jgi:choline dehydrogenase-like flavoprotein
MTPEVIEADIAIIGSGPGGSTLARGLSGSGAGVAVFERGDFLPSEPQNWDVEEVFDKSRYRAEEYWVDADGRPFRPNSYYFVGGSSKVWGACLTRLRREDFGLIDHIGGTSPRWPIDYDELAPYYERAEALFDVHGPSQGDPTTDVRPKPPRGPVEHEPELARVVGKLVEQGVHPYTLPLGIDLHAGGSCLRCRTCDGFPCRVRAKNDAEVRALTPVVESGAVQLYVGTRITRLVTDAGGDRVVAAEAFRGRRPVEIRAEKFVLSAGAANSAAILLRSASAAHPDGLANSSGMVGRNYMQHQFTALMAVRPTRTRLVYTKTVGFNDFYLDDGEGGPPLGNVQTLGKLQGGMLAADKKWVPRPLLNAMAERSSDWWVTTEDLPDPENRVTLTGDGRIKVSYRRNNVIAQRRLTAIVRRLLRGAGYPLVIAQEMGPETTSAQCGTARAGRDRRDSVVDPLCRAHDVGNLYIVDSSFFPSAGALNPGLTIAAQALRVAELSDLAGGGHGVAAAATAGVPAAPGGKASD